MIGSRISIAAAAVWLVTVGAAVGQTVTFENDAAGQPPKDFEFGVAGEGGPGRWQVVADATAAGGKALAQLTTNPVAHRFLVAIYNPVTSANVEVTARCRPMSGKTDQACGVIVRAVNARNYYIARSNVLESNVRFYRIRNSQRQQLATAENVKIARGEWHTLTLRVVGDQYTVLFNGKLVHTTADTTTGLPRPESGRVGLWTKADSVTHFDRIEIKRLP
jgi:hypothetical protein